MSTKVTFPNGKTYFSDSALAVCSCGIMARANIETIRIWAEEEYGDDFSERATHYRFNRPDVEEFHAGAWPTKPVVFTSDSRMGDDAAAWIREDLWQRWALGDQLESYACLDEQRYSEFEELAKREAFTTWIIGEVESAMEKAGFSEDEIAAFSGEQLYRLFYDSVRDADAEWIEQSAADMWVEVEKVLPIFLAAARNHLAKEAVL